MFEWPGGHIPNKGTTSTFYDEMGVDEWPMIPHMMKNLKKAFNKFKIDKIDMAGTDCFVSKLSLARIV